MSVEREEIGMFIYEVDEAKRIAAITFNRPERLNAMSMEEARVLADLLEKPQRDDRVKVIILKGAGRAFAVGDNLNVFLSEYGVRAADGKPKYERPTQAQKLTVDDKFLQGPRGLHQTVLGCNKATIAQVQGYVYGGHFLTAMYCDLTIAAEGTMFTHTGFRLMGPSATGLATALIINVGLKRAMELMLTGRPFEAKEAQRIGLVNAVVPPDQLNAEVQRYAQTIALLSLDGIVVGKYATRVALEKLGFFGYSPVVLHNLGTNVKWAPDDFNMLKEQRDRGTKAAIKALEARYAAFGMDLDTQRRLAAGK